jgi:glutathione S-transferase
MTEIYTIFGGELSYFTRKLEAAMVFYDARFVMKNKNEEDPSHIELRSGTHQVPVLLTPENWMIGDTTPIMHLMDSRFPARAMYPAGPLGILVQIVEEYFDEWVARTMVHYRWHYPRSAQFASMKMANGNEEVAKRVRDWGPRACRATGTDSDHQRTAAEEEFKRILTAMETQLDATPYLLGGRPTAVDCVVLGSLWAHINMDPDPKEMLQAFPRVLAWCEGEAQTWDGQGVIAPFPESTGFARFILAEMQTTYQPYILANGEAQGHQAKAFHAEIYGEDVSFLSRPYPEKSRQMIVDKIGTLTNKDESQQVLDWLAAVALNRCFVG